MRDFLDKVMTLRRERRSFATATVVGRRAPVSAHLGDRAIVHEDGRMEGFIGGACSREIIRRQALESIRARRARLVSIRPDAGINASSDPEHVFVPMTCVSEGAVDVYVEPNLRPRRLVVIGATPVAEALSRTAVALDYEVIRLVEEGEQRDLDAPAASQEVGEAGEVKGTSGWTVAPLESLSDAITAGGPETAAVVATQGHYDERALEMILRARAASYVGLVASPKRGAAVKESLAQSGITGADIDSVRVPAGLDLGARTAPEVAIAILAEIVQSRPDQALDAEPRDQRDQAASREGRNSGGASAPPPAMALDPVCQMEVEIATAKHTAEVDGTTYYFCCPRCRSSFVKEPARYLASRS
jgi:xanthine dehydrogenase accessory factor